MIVLYITIKILNNYFHLNAFWWYIYRTGQTYLFAKCMCKFLTNVQRICIFYYCYIKNHCLSYFNSSCTSHTSKILISLYLCKNSELSLSSWLIQKNLLSFQSVSKNYCNPSYIEVLLKTPKKKKVSIDTYTRIKKK